ncbi:hypothetical protein GWI33_016613 [Rhynchophorus ferrugineus]|uniref:Uncharacterized protein n=1 Tax=Rhynchophorus ferrugineus TaxID=354439 RepID=A0A834M4T9_RHYFE|nr:hypothetical protein GWI33_016613 [Rhynchophorus ferrugineus]
MQPSRNWGCPGRASPTRNSPLDVLERRAYELIYFKRMRTPNRSPGDDIAGTRRRYHPKLHPPEGVGEFSRPPSPNNPLICQNIRRKSANSSADLHSNNDVKCGRVNKLPRKG